MADSDTGDTVSAMGCHARDYDNDGWVDIFYNNLMQQLSALFRNQRGSAFADFTDDGFLDLVVTSLNDRLRILISSADNGNHWLL